MDNGPARIITACAATPAAIADVMPHLISKALEQHNILPQDVGADTKYGTADNYRFLIESWIKPSMPHHGGKNATGLLTKDNFIYDKEKDQYTCPQGKVLKNNGFVKNLRHFIYRINPKNCKGCKLLKECTKSPTGRSVTQHVNESFLEQAKEHLKTPQAEATLAQRGEYVENAFACEKKDLGLNKAKFRGLISVHIQSLLTATAYNLKKLVKYSRDFKEKLKTTIDLPILPLVETNMSQLRQRFTDSRLVCAVSRLRNFIFSFLNHIFGFKLACNVT